MSIRENYSLNDIEKMLGDIDSVVSSHRAKQQGIDPQNMVKTIRGGKVIWITVDEMNAILAKQRKITGAKIAQRSIRGEDSLSSEINRRVEACRALIHAIRKIAPQESPEFTARMRSLEAVHNISLSQAREVHLLEMAIQRKKQEDPLLREMENATEDIVQSVQENTLVDVDINQSYCDRHMEEYLARQKRLDPYRKKAKECRKAFLLSKQQLFQFQYDLIQKGEKTLSQNLDEILYYDKEGSISSSLLEFAIDIRSMVQQAQSQFQTLSELPVDQLDERKDLFCEIDQKYLANLFKMMICFVERFQEAWTQFVESKSSDSTQLPINRPDLPKTKKKRMIYPEKHSSTE